MQTTKPRTVNSELFNKMKEFPHSWKNETIPKGTDQFYRQTICGSEIACKTDQSESRRTKSI
ncbi:hypothetical protein DLM77_17895 [Leptospira yasudae]|uniref:Uncharacterized protein n=1 Tax=Leptospira yasudae TaxID=2202201 RepID=A0ABX9LZD9_9LEPT|nr:hypothetical protein DLM77_17895 [Leptospira yasudae]